MRIRFMLSKDSGDNQHMHSKSNNIEIVIENNTNKIIYQLFSSLLTRSQIGLETLMRGSDFFDSIDGMNYQCKEIMLKRGKLYIGSFD